MSVRKLTASLLTALALLGGAATSHAQEYAPVADPFAFDPDFRWFEPVYHMDLADMKPKHRASTGWFATYDRLNLYGSRPETTEPGASEYLLDSGWGHRYEIGFMLPGEDNGWMFNWTENDVTQNFVVREERLNRFVEDDDLDILPPFGFPRIPDEANVIGFGRRFFDVSDSQNVFNYDSYELNKTWRLEPYHYGGILEPMVGVRYMEIEDKNFFQNFSTTIDNPPLVIPDVDDAERLTTSKAITENTMFGGQAGFRYLKFLDRFTLSSDFRVFFGGSWQSSKAKVTTETFIYDGTGDGAELDAVLREATEPIYSRNEEIFVGFDVRGQVGYQLTKMISIRGGFQLIDVATGVWRGGDGIVIESGDKDQDLVMLGGTFGLNLNH